MQKLLPNPEARFCCLCGISQLYDVGKAWLESSGREGAGCGRELIQSGVTAPGGPVNLSNS